MKSAVAFVVLAALVAGASAECPNACSGHGECSQNDMCVCYRNWQANDCSERVCPYGIAFTTTPQGDVNMDGDMYDSNKKLIVVKSGSDAGDPILASIATLTNTITFSQDLAAGELGVGDCISFENNRRCVTGVSSTDPLKVFTLDSDIDTDINFKPVYRFLESIAAPGGTWESWPGDAAASSDDEGHFYMECSNQGLCDRSTGICQCFDGFSGRGCGRSSCPEGCSGHGVCLTVSELAVRNPQKVSATIEVTKGESFVATSVSTIGSVSVGDSVFLGEQAQYEAENLYTVTSISASGFSVEPVAAKTLPFGSTLYHAPKYNLWDADKNQACQCDAGYGGFDCASRVCPSGADPLDLVGEDMSTSVSSTSISSTYTKSTESQVITLDSACGTVAGTFTLTHTDENFGYKRSTSSIAVEPKLSSTVSISTPPSIDATYCTSDASTYDISDATKTCYSYVKFTPHLPLWELSAGDFIRVGNQYRKIGACTVDTTSGNYSSCYTTNSFDSQYGEGSYAYSTNTANNIANELKNLPNDLFSTSTAVSKVVSGLKTSDAATGFSSSKVAVALGASELCVGDKAKVTASSDDHRTQVVGLDFDSGTGKISHVNTGSAGKIGITDGATNVYRDSGARYEVDMKLAGNPTELACDASSLRSVYHSAKAGYVMRSKPSRVFFVDPTFGSNQPAYSPIDGGSNQVGHPMALSEGDVIYVGEQRCTVGGVDSDGSVTATAQQAAVSAGSTSSVYSANSNIHYVDCLEVLEATSSSTEDEIETHAHVSVVVGSTVSCSSTDMKPLEWDVYPFENTRSGTAPVAYGKCTEGNAHNCVQVSAKGASTTCSDSDNDYSGCRTVKAGSITTSPAASFLDHTLQVGDRVTLEVTETGLFETRKIDYIKSDWTEFTVSKAFTAGHTGRMWVNKQGTKSLSECSGRGLCAGDAGDCECFKGYHDIACSSQSALAA